MMGHRLVVVAAVAIAFAAVAVLVTLAFRTEGNTQGVSANSATIDDVRNLARRVARNTRRLDAREAETGITVKRLKPQVTRLNRVVLGRPGDRGLAGQSIRGPRGITGLTTVGAQGEFGPIGPEGPLGPIGGDGPPGPGGQDGATGPNGEDGAPGKDGADGANGADGAAGPQGPVGSIEGQTCTETRDLIDPTRVTFTNCTSP